VSASQLYQEEQLANKSNKKQSKKQDRQDDAWLSMRTGMIVITIVSLAIGAWTAWNALPAEGLGMSIFWGVVFGGSIWLVFFGAYFLNRWVRKR
jgi:uncharacterized membrane-anchored protein